MFWKRTEFYDQYLIPKYKNCMSDFKLDEFCVYNNEITFFSDFFFSSAEKQYRPDLDFSLSFEEIKAYLKVNLWTLFIISNFLK